MQFFPISSRFSDFQMPPDRSKLKLRWKETLPRVVAADGRACVRECVCKYEYECRCKCVQAWVRVCVCKHARGREREKCIQSNNPFKSSVTIEELLPSVIVAE